MWIGYRKKKTVTMLKKIEDTMWINGIKVLGNKI